MDPVCANSALHALCQRDDGIWFGYDLMRLKNILNNADSLFDMLFLRD